MIDFKYRPDVDGLRAVAVTLVLLFHAGLGFSGGFIGVDVFFVISGFLITGLILKEQDAGTFSLANFWIRRIRRIIPAATTMVLVVLVVSFFLLIPVDYADLGKSAVAQQLMLSNVYFWKNTGYFDGPADLKPLLHTWSLAVEEQYYLGYPFLLMLLHRFGRRLTFVVLGFFALGSLAVSQWGVQHHPPAAFYLLPPRAWEMLLGGLICFLPKPTRIPQGLLAFCSWLCLAAVLSAGWFYTSTTPFPGLTALVPCVATAVFIYSNSNHLSFPSAILAKRPLVFVGLISYSLYLWHWPILVLMRHNLDAPAGLFAPVIALFFSVAAGYASWRWIETPIRKGSWVIHRRTVVGAAFACSALCVTLGAAIYLSNGFARLRFGSDYLVLLRSMNEHAFRHELKLADLMGGRIPKFGAISAEPNILVWGDSHAMAAMPAIDQACKELGLAGVQITASGTLPLLDFTNPRDRSKSTKLADEVIAYCDQNKIGVAILVGYWRRDAQDPSFESCMRETVQRLVQLGVKVVVVRDVPDQKEEPLKLIEKAFKNASDIASLGVRVNEHRADQAAADAVLLQMTTIGAVVLDPTPYVCDEDGRCPLVVNGKCMYWDNDHLTVTGANRLIPMFRRALIDMRLVLQ